MPFASATCGFRSGGWNARSESLADFLPFGPEKAWSYETGFRSTSFGHTSRVNATGFLTDPKGFQLPLGLVRPDGSISFQTQNGSDFRNYGVEGELAVAPARNLTVFGNVGVQRAEYRNPSALIQAQQARCLGGDTGSCGQGIVAPDGSLATPQRPPKLTLAMGASYDADLGSLVLTPSGNATYRSSYVVGTPATANDFVAPQWVANASLFLRDPGRRVKFGVECANCLNNLFETISFSPIYKFYDMPRTIRAIFGVTF